VSPVRIAVTLGDPRGIGPEVTEAALADREIAGAASFVRVGPDALVGPDGVGAGGWTAADGAPAAGRVAGEAIRRAVAMALAGEVDAVVTAPIDKAAFHAGGWNYPGHTEMLAELAAVPRVAMLMAAERTALGGPLRVVLATTHLALVCPRDRVTGRPGILTVVYGGGLALAAVYQILLYEPAAYTVLHNLCQGLAALPVIALAVMLGLALADPPPSLGALGARWLLGATLVGFVGPAIVLGVSGASGGQIPVNASAWVGFLFPLGAAMALRSAGHEPIVFARTASSASRSSTTRPSAAAARTTSS